MLSPLTGQTARRFLPAGSPSEITIAEEYDRVYHGLNDPVLRDAGKGKQLKIVNASGWKDTPPAPRLLCCGLFPFVPFSLKRHLCLEDFV